MIAGNAVIHELLLPVAPQEAFAMFTVPEQLVRWIGISAELEPRPGGCFRFEVTPGQFCEGRYIEIERPHRLVLSWGWTDERLGVPPGSSRVEVTFRPVGEDGGATQLRLVHTGLGSDARMLHEDGWTRFLDRLVAVADGREAAPYPDEEPEERLRWLST